MKDPQLIQIIRQQFALDWCGIHGWPHGNRVRESGLRLAERTGARPRVVELFAWLHDSRRLNDGRDPGHGARAGRFARSLAGTAFELDAPDIVLLVEACRHHSEGLREGDMTLLTCWDADRLDLGRVGILPRADWLCPETARDPELLEWACLRSQE
ncbi:MAG: hypothetical protein ACE15F_12960 [bacterium]